MSYLKRRLSVLTASAVIAVAGFGASTDRAEAAIICPDNADGSTIRSHTLDNGTPQEFTNANSSCFGSGGDNPALTGNPTNDVVIALDGSLEQTAIITGSSTSDGPLSLNFSPDDDQSSVNFTLANPGTWTKLVLAMKVGNVDPTWVAFLVPLDTTGGTWTTAPNQGGGLSGFAVYTSVIPLPASALLLLGGIGGLGALRAARRKTA